MMHVIQDILGNKLTLELHRPTYTQVLFHKPIGKSLEDL